MIVGMDMAHFGSVIKMEDTASMKVSGQTIYKMVGVFRVVLQGQ